jgi:hypothetical protein
MNTIAKQAMSAATTVSGKYTFLSTERLYEMLADYGFREDRYKQSRQRNPERQGYQRHVSILQREQDCDQYGGFNLLLLNSHDGTSSIHLEAGYFRVLCENQLGHGDVGVRIRHTGDVLSKLEQAIPRVLNQMDEFKALQAMLQSRTLPDEQAIALIEKALELRGLPVTPYNRTQFSFTRRKEGERNAWMQFNVIQENMVRGGILVQSKKVSSPDTLTTSYSAFVGELRKLRALTSADRLLNANRELTATVRQLIAA